MAKDSSEIAQAIVQRLASLIDADVVVTLEVQANMPGGAPDAVVRTVSENARTLKFDSCNFEEFLTSKTARIIAGRLLPKNPT